MSHRRLASCRGAPAALLAAALASCGSDPPDAPAAHDGHGAAVPVTPRLRAVTLLTGDRVHLGPAVPEAELLPMVQSVWAEP